MVETDLALMIADIKRVSHVFRGFKTACMFEKSQVSFRLVKLELFFASKSKE